MTVPLGCHLDLDRAICAGETGRDVCGLRRLNAESEWDEGEAEAAGDPAQGRPNPGGKVVTVLACG